MQGLVNPPFYDDAVPDIDCPKIHADSGKIRHSVEEQYLRLPLPAQLTYDKAPLTLGNLHTSAWVFALLGAFYATIGACFPALDCLALRQGSGLRTIHPIAVNMQHLCQRSTVQG